MIDFIKNNKDKIFKSIAKTEMSLPSLYKLENRHLVPKFLSIALEGMVPDNWMINNKIINVKTTRYYPFSKYNGLRRTNPIPIQLSNTKSSKSVKKFDYLLLIVIRKYCGLYLYDFDSVKDLLKYSKKYGCDENGYDGKGQIKLYLEDKNCLHKEEFLGFHKLCKSNKTKEEIDEYFNKKQNELIESVIEYATQ